MQRIRYQDARVELALNDRSGSFATGGSQAIRIPRPRSPESRPSSHPKATIDRCIAVTHAADQKADINCNASKEKGGSFSRPPLSLK
jgi:hypothetical protein